ncbi:MAG: hypothetical protein II143_06005 [Bacteroidales bacterium]|nr:hypothetical protein [Bacteroidales bacterium]
MKKVFVILAVVAAALSAVSCADKPAKDDSKGGVEVAADALVAYFPLDDSSEKVGNLTFDASGAGTEANFVPGRRNKCYQGTKDSYLRFNIPAGSPIKTMKAMSLSMWLKHAEIDWDCVPVPMVFQITRTDDRCWGNFGMSCDRTDKGAGFLTWKCVFQGEEQTSDGPKPAGIWKTTNAFTEEDGVKTYNWPTLAPAGRWNHIIYAYDNVTSTFHCYLNGADITPENEVDCIFGEKKAGDLKFINAEQIMIGNWDVKYTSAEGWGWKDEWIGGFENGQVDEIRLFNRALTAAEAKALYDAEVAAMTE